MSVLIKGMEMPPDCRVCPFEMYYMNTGKTRCGAAMRTLAENFKTIPFVGRADFCPLIELLPHGRLIDADALIKKQPIPELGAPRWLIEQAPTIIPADEPTQSNAPNTLDALTNADRIRAMTDMELAKELSRIHGTCDWCPMHDDCDGENCDGQLLDWLKEVTE